jgi:hypothetical protein
LTIGSVLYASPAKGLIQAVALSPWLTAKNRWVCFLAMESSFGTHLETETDTDEEQRADAKPQAIVDSVANTARVDQGHLREVWRHADDHRRATTGVGVKARWPSRRSAYRRRPSGGRTITRYMSSAGRIGAISTRPMSCAPWAAPYRRESQSDGRIRHWLWVPDRGRWLRVVTEADGETVHNTFWDRGFRP